MDSAIAEAWAYGSDNAFAQMLYMIQSENVPVDYQHSETGITPLMVAGARGSTEIIEQLFVLGADPYIKSCNHYTALDWAKYLDNTNVLEALQGYLITYESDKSGTCPEPECEKKLSESDRKLLQLYQNSVDDEVIDSDLILALLVNINNEGPKGAILVFLPGYDSITAMRELILHEEKKLFHKNKVLVLVLHANMQTCDQKLVFKAPPPGTRKIILSTNVGETSITIDDVVFVIDSGKVKEKSYNPSFGMSQLSTVWISKSCAQQRKGRAGRTQPGICYRLYSTVRYESFPQYRTPDILRSPLQELCLFSKLLAPPNTSIVDFLSRAIDPPSSIMSRCAVILLKTIDALDTWEDLTDLGHHLVELPVEPRHGKMLIYACVLKCLDPILTIVSCLSYREVFSLPAVPEERKHANQERIRFSSGSLSDHMVFLRVFQEWQIARKQNREKQFCSEHFVNGATMEYIVGTRAQLMAQLRASGFVKSKGPGDIKYVNTNSENWAVVKAALVAGLYPNLARVDRDHNVIRTTKEHKVGMHANSVLQDGKHEDASSVISRLPTDWVIYEELARVGRLVQLRTATVVSPLTVALFAGPSKIPFDAVSDTHRSQDSDSNEEEVAPDLNATLKLDDWIIFRMDSECAQLVLQLRIKWHSLLAKKLRAANSNKMLNLVLFETITFSPIKLLLFQLIFACIM
ncbi:hypothetical protein AAG570_008364 [Ranatra chinensis]|uniref:Helicase C-terminal domain-containing protein n=1 Tax=Ranatra chinensis TaxID=642074 RepID=A0ABD0XSY1_9HEMI